VEEERLRKASRGAAQEARKRPGFGSGGYERPEQEERERLERLHGWNRRGDGQWGYDWTWYNDAGMNWDEMIETATN
jgi:hypothetical protein